MKNIIYNLLKLVIKIKYLYINSFNIKLSIII